VALTVIAVCGFLKIWPLFKRLSCFTNIRGSSRGPETRVLFVLPPKSRQRRNYITFYKRHGAFVHRTPRTLRTLRPSRPITNNWGRSVFA